MALSPRARQIFGGGSGTADVAKKSDLAAKADRTYVDSAVSSLPGKADKTYVDAELAKKVATTTLTTELAKKMDKTAKVMTGASISGKVITFTFADNTSSTITLP